MTMLTVGDRIWIEKGCTTRRITKGTSARVIAIRPLGADYSHSVAVTFQMLNGFRAGETVTWYARHVNRLNDCTVNLNDGNPLHKIVIARR